MQYRGEKTEDRIDIGCALTWGIEWLITRRSRFGAEMTRDHVMIRLCAFIAYQLLSRQDCKLELGMSVNIKF